MVVPIYLVSILAGRALFPKRNRQQLLSKFYLAPAFSIALMIILLASSPARFVTVKCATDRRRRVFFFASTAISVICIATRGAFRSTIITSRSLSFAISHLQHQYRFCHLSISISTAEACKSVAFGH